MRLDLPPAFFLGAYLRLAMLGGLGLFVLGAGAAWAIPLDAALPQPVNAFGVALALVGLAVWAGHAWWLSRAPRTELEPFLRRAFVTIGALAFLAGSAFFGALAISRLVSGAFARGELTIASLSLALTIYFARRLTAELRS